VVALLGAGHVGVQECVQGWSHKGVKAAADFHTQCALFRAIYRLRLIILRSVNSLSWVRPITVGFTVGRPLQDAVSTVRESGRPHDLSA